MKKLITVFTICFLALFISSCALAKVTDPKDPAFDITQFRFEDYKTDKDFLGAIYNVIPVGTSEEKVRKILVDYAGSQETLVLVLGRKQTLFRKKMEPTGIYACNYSVRVEYDAGRKLKDFHSSFGCTGP